jgi:Chaperone of endosialidase
MAIPRITLLSHFKNGLSPTEVHFKSLIESIVSREDDGIDKDIDSPLKIMAGSQDYAPVISLVPKGLLDPLWMISLKAFQKDGLNIGQGDTPQNPVVFLEKATSNVGLGTNTPSGQLEIYRDINGEVGAILQNPNDGAAAYVIHRLKTRGGDGVIFKNSNMRPDDGGVNTMTVRNDAGDLRMQSQGAVGSIVIKGDTGFVGINTASPAQPLEVNGAMNLSGNSLFFPKTTGIVNSLGAVGLFWNGASTPTVEQFNYGIYRTDGQWSTSPQQLRLQFASGIQLAPGTGPNAGIGSKSYVEVVNGKGLMVSSGNLGVGTVLPSGKAHVVTAASSGDTGAWGSGQFVVGMEAANGPSSGAIALSYSNLINGGTSFISSLSPNVNYRDLGIRASNTIFYAGALELMRLAVDGKLGIGTNAPAAQLHVKRDANEGTQMFLANGSAGAAAFVSMGFFTNNNAGWIFRNSSTRVDDGGFNTMTVRNDKGDLRLQAEGQVGMIVKAVTGDMGLGTSNPNGRLDVVGGAVVLNSGLTPVSPRPMITNGRVLGEISGYSSTAFNADDGFLRLSAGGGTAPGQKSYIDLTGFSTLPDMANNIVIGTGGMERMRIMMDGSVGIGTNAPIGLLHLRRDTNTQVSQFLSNLSNLPNALVAIGLQTDLGSGYMFKNSSTRTVDGGPHTMTVRNDRGDLRLQAEGQVGMLVRAISGFVGIGTNNPNGRLDVATGPLLINSGITNASIRPTVTNMRGLGEIGAYSSAGFLADDGFVRLSAGGGTTAGTKSYIDLSGYSTIPDMDRNLVFGTGGVERMRLSGDGNLGIGTNTPSGLLQVRRDFNDATRVWLSNLSNQALAQVAFGLQTDNSVGFLFKNSSTRVIDGGVNTMTLRNDLGDLRLMSEVQPGITIKSATGNIAFGSAAGDHFLHARRDQDGVVNSILRNASAGVNAVTQFAFQNDLNWGVLYKNSSTRMGDGGPNAMTMRNEVGDLRLQAQGANGLIVKALTGFVGIGTPDPQVPLHVRRDSVDALSTLITNTTSGNNVFVQIGIQTDNGGGYLFKNSSTRLIDGGPNTMTLRNDGGDLRLQATSGVNGLHVKALTGFVGVATTNPISMLSVGGNLTIGAGRASSTAAPVNGLLVEGDTIVNGALLAQQALRMGQFAPGSIGTLELLPGDGSPIGNRLVFGTDNSGWKFTIAKRQSGTLAITDLMVFQDNGFVGIGTPTPQGLLHLRRDSVDPLSAWITNSNAGSTVFTQIALQTDSGVGALFKNSSTRAADGGINTMTLRNDNGDLRLQAAGGINGLHVKATIGSVGIGTTDPQGMLHVRRDSVDPLNVIMTNTNAGTNVYGLFGIQTDNGYGILFKNSSTRTADGGVNTMTLRNDKGDLRLQAEGGGNGLHVKAVTGSVGISTTIPKEKFQVNGGNIALGMSDNPALQMAGGGHNLGALMFYGHGRAPGNDSAKIYCGSTLWDDAGFLEFCTSNDGAASIPRMRITELGKVGVGTSNPAGRMHVVTTSSDGNVSAWDTGQFVVGQDGSTGGGVGLSYNSAFNISTITSMSPGIGWRELHVRAHRTVFHSNGGTEVMRVDDNNLVGIGTNRPLAPLSIGFSNGKEDWPDPSMHITNDCILFGGANAYRGGEPNSCQISAGKHGQDTMCIVGMSDANGANRKIDMWAEGGMNVYGRMCIGLSRIAPSYPLQINTAVSAPIGPYWYMNRYTTGGPGNMVAGVSIWSADRIVASEFNAISDARVKENMQVSNPVKDLMRLQQIEVTDYQYRDFLSKGNALQKGFIAQQVQAIYPEAVASHTEFIPDIYDNPLKFEIKEKPLTKADVDALSGIASTTSTEEIDYASMQKNVLYITMGKNHELAKGQRVRVMSRDGQADKPAIVINKRTFAIDGWEFGTEDLFVYGRQVDDFMVVDYNRIYSLNVSATQELHRQVDTLKDENAQLRKQIAAIQKALGTLGVKFEA